MEQTEVKKEQIYQAGNVKNIVTTDESKVRTCDDTNTYDPFEIQHGKTDSDQISIRMGGRGVGSRAEKSRFPSVDTAV